MSEQCSFFSCLLNERARKRPCDGLVHCAMRCWWDVDGVRDHGSWLTQNSRARTRFVMCKLRKRKKKRAHTHRIRQHSLSRTFSTFFVVDFFFRVLLRFYLFPRDLLSSVHILALSFSLLLLMHSFSFSPSQVLVLLRTKQKKQQQQQKQQGKKWVNLCVALVPKLYLLVGNFLWPSIFNLPTDLLW